MDPERRYFFPVVGFNYRLSNLACALLCAQLERSAGLARRRAEIYERYRHGLGDVPGIGLQPVADWAAPAPWLFCIVVDQKVFGMSRDQLAAKLDADGIETRPFFHPLHRLPPYEGRPGAGRTLPVTDSLATAGMNLPTFTQMTSADVERVVEGVRRAAG
jgi:perosamine synthetase